MGVLWGAPLGDQTQGVFTQRRFSQFQVCSYPHTPQPKDAVNRMEKITNAIIHMSSGFMVVFPSRYGFQETVGKISHCVVNGRLGLLDDNHGLFIGTLDLDFRCSRHLGFKTQGPHHHDAKNPPADLPGPYRRESAK